MNRLPSPKNSHNQNEPPAVITFYKKYDLKRNNLNSILIQKVQTHKCHKNVIKETLSFEYIQNTFTVN